MKLCKLCDEYKDVNDFRKGRNQCKKCLFLKMKDWNKNYYLDNKEELLLKMKDNYVNNIDDRKESNRKYREDNKDEIKKYRQHSIEIKKIYNKNYRIDNKEKLKDYNIEYHKNRLKTDSLFRLKSILRKRICSIFKKKTLKTEEIIGCSFEEFKLHLESQFQDWMNWDNYGLYCGELNYGWDIDHKIPLSSALTEEEVLKLNHYTNLQPLCSKVNRDIKRDKLDFY